MWPSHPDLEPASFGEVLDPLEGLVLLPIHIEPVHLQTTHRELTDCKLYTANGKIVHKLASTIKYSPDAGVGRFRGGSSNEVD